MPFVAPFQLRPISGTKLFPDTIQAPPITRILIGLDGPIPDGVETGQVQKMGEDLIKQRLGSIHHFLQAQRQHTHGGLAVWFKSLDMPPLNLSYGYSHGQETFFVRCLVRLKDLPKPKPPSEPPVKCLLVMYNSNQIAAIPMTGLTAPVKSLGTVYNATLKQSNWRGTKLQVTQLNLSKDFAPIMAPFVVVKHVIMTGDYYFCWNTKDFSGEYAVSLTPSPTTKLMHSGVVISSDGIGRFTTEPVINGSGLTVYFNFETFTLNLDTKKISMTSDAASATADGGDYRQLVSPNMVSAGGVYYWGADAASWLSQDGFYGGINNYPDSQAAAVVAANNRATTVVGTTTTVQGRCLFYGGPGAAKVTVGARGAPSVQVQSGGSGTFTYNSTISLAIPRMQFSQVNGLDRIDVMFDTAVVTDHSNTTISSFHGTGTSSFSVSYLGFLTASTSTAVAGVISGYAEEDSYYMQNWPYWPGAKPYTNLSKVSRTGFEDVFITPYKTLPGNYGQGAMHVSNGEHFIQTFSLGSDPTVSPSFYLDGADISALIAAAIKSPTSSIDAVLMDIDLADIKQLV